MNNLVSMRSRVLISTSVIAATLALLPACGSLERSAGPTRFDQNPTVELSEQADRSYRSSEAARTAVGFYEAFQTTEFSSFDDVLAVDWSDIPLGPGQGAGLAGWEGQVQYFDQALSGLTISIDALYVDGNTVTVRSTFNGVQSGPFLGVEPTGRNVEFRTVDIHQVEHGKIQTSWHLEDSLGALAQLTSSDE